MRLRQLGLCADHALFEGQGAMELEALAETWPSSPDEQPYTFEINEHDGMLYLESLPMWQALLEDLGRQTPLAQMALRFHHGLAMAIRDMVAHIRGMRWANSLTQSLSAAAVSRTSSC